jgi:streptogramin lyase
MALNTQPRARCRPRIRPSLEGLEARTLLASYITRVPITSAIQPLALTEGPNGQIWFTALAGSLDTGYHSIIAEIDPATKVVTQVQLSPADQLIENPLLYPSGVTTGPDGDIWFTDPTAALIGKIDPTTLAVSEYPINGGKPAGGIAVGPDGDLWFTEPVAGKVGKIDPSTDAVTEYALPSATSQPLGISAGSDGNVWFTETGNRTGGIIGEIFPSSGEISEYPTAGSLTPQRIISGPDGNIYFSQILSESLGGSLGEINVTTHVATRYDAPADSGLMIGSDGQIWFTTSSLTDRAAPTIGEFDVNTQLWSVKVVTGIGPYADSWPTSLATGSDGNIWANEFTWFDVLHTVPTDQSAIIGYATFDTAGDGNYGFEQLLVNRSVYLDLQGDGKFDPGDPIAVTDVGGQFVFPGLAPGSYTVRVLTYPGEIVSTSSSNGMAITVQGGDVGEVDFAIQTQTSILPITRNTNPFGVHNPDIETAVVTGFYRNILGRAPDAAGLSGWVTELKSGTSPLQVAEGFFNSFEYEKHLVAGDYQSFLGRSGTTSEIDAWVARMQGGQTAEQVALGFFASVEYSRLHSTADDFVTSLYANVLARSPAQVEVSAWAAILASGESRTAVAEGFIESMESFNLTVNGLVAILFVQSPSSSSLPWVDSLASGSTFAEVASSIASSPAYKGRANPSVG